MPSDHKVLECRLLTHDINLDRRTFMGAGEMREGSRVKKKIYISTACATVDPAGMMARSTDMRMMGGKYGNIRGGHTDGLSVCCVCTTQTHTKECVREREKTKAMTLSLKLFHTHRRREAVDRHVDTRNEVNENLGNVVE